MASGLFLSALSGAVPHGEFCSVRSIVIGNASSVPRNKNSAIESVGALDRSLHGVMRAPIVTRRWDKYSTR
jgi:hypothetical protein